MFPQQVLEGGARPGRASEWSLSLASLFDFQTPTLWLGTSLSGWNGVCVCGQVIGGWKRSHFKVSKTCLRETVTCIPSTQVHSKLRQQLTQPQESLTPQPWTNASFGWKHFYLRGPVLCWFDQGLPFPCKCLSIARKGKVNPRSWAAPGVLDIFNMLHLPRALEERAA